MSFPAGTFLYNLFIVSAIWCGAALAIFGLRSPRFIRAAITFSAGVFLGVAFLHMIPESVERLGMVKAGLFVLLGYLLIYVLERFVMVHPCEEETCDYHTVGLAAFLGLSLHSLMNGLALGCSLLFPGLGVAVFFATLVHKAPEAFSLTSLLVLGNRGRTEVFSYVALFSIMVPLGTLAAIAGIPPLGGSAAGAAVAVSAGTFLHIATGDLLTGTHSKNGRKLQSLLGLMSGIGFALLTKWLER